MINYIKASSIGEAWLMAAKFVITNGSEVQDGAETIIETIPLMIEIVEPVIDDAVIQKFGNKEHIEFLTRNFEELSEIEDWGFSYAQRLYRYNNANQIEQIVERLRDNPLSKSATISLLIKEADVKHTPCLTTLDFKIRNETLIVTASFRSQDIGKKMYGDALALLKIALSIIPNFSAQGIVLILSISSAHIYQTDLKHIQSIIRSYT